MKIGGSPSLQTYGETQARPTSRFCLFSRFSRFCLHVVGVVGVVCLVGFVGFVGVFCRFCLFVWVFGWLLYFAEEGRTKCKA